MDVNGFVRPDAQRLMLGGYGGMQGIAVAIDHLESNKQLDYKPWQLLASIILLPV